MGAPADPQETAPDRPAARALRATCRLQLYRGMDLAGARALVPYLRDLGISHLYLSPILHARARSDHGYDAVDFTRIDPRLGDEADLAALADALHAAGMGLILDIVPNHMAADAANRAWMDVLANGRGSVFADWFDVDWNAGEGKVVLPVLGERLPAAIASGGLRLVQEDGLCSVRYHEHRFPLHEPALPAVEALGGLAAFQGPEGATALRALMDRQYWRLVHWKRAADEINYRRFFTINDLVTLRQDDPRVFQLTHATVLGWVRRGLVDGLRIDHVDGLLDPGAYLRRLRRAVPEATLHVEKILARDELLPADWPVDGTTGYDFLAETEDLFVDPAGWRRLERDWRRLVRRDVSGADLGVRAKKRILERHLTADLRRVVRLVEAAARARGTKPPRTTALTGAVTEVLAELPVYRTYIRPGRREAARADRILIEDALANASRSGADGDAIALLRSLLLEPDAWTGNAGDARAKLVGRLQQLGVPAAAKGIEDTLFYAWVPLASRNEVGAEPVLPPGDAVQTFHIAAARRAARYPSALLAVSTHDTKRSADLRARLDVLSEIPETWARAVRRWRRWNRVARTRLHGRLVPDAATELLWYQTLVGAWPLDDLAAGDHPPATPFVERIDAYLLKAAREAKLNTSWVRPDAGFEESLHRYVHEILQPAAGASPFLAAVRAFAAHIAGSGLWNALSRTLLHFTAPGVPDLYQGGELWRFDLVDPDNRRPVDFAVRAALLDAHAEPTELVASAHDGRIKLHIIRRALALRAEWPDVFQDGAYTPLTAHGAASEHIVAYARTREKRTVVVAVPRLVHSLCGPNVPPTGAVWGDTTLQLPPATQPLRCTLTGRTLDHDDSLPTATLFETLPVALLHG